MSTADTLVDHQKDPSDYNQNPLELFRAAVVQEVYLYTRTNCLHTRAGTVSFYHRIQPEMELM